MSGEQNAALLAALASADFDWIDRSSSVWEDDPCDVPAIHGATLRALEQRLAKADRNKDGAPLGISVIGAAGAGKTHLLGALRHSVWQRNGYFILIDLTGVRDFPLTATLGFLRALEHRLPDGMLQHEKVLERLANTYVGPGTGVIVKDIRKSGDAASARELLDALQRGLSEHLRTELVEHADVLRALVFYSVGGFRDADVAYNWLQGADIPEAREQLGLRQSSRPADSILAGLSWLMSLTGPCVVGIDQLDAIVGAYHTLAQGSADDDDTRRARAIIDGVAIGLMDLIRSWVKRSVVAMCCIEAAWDHLRRNAPRAAMDSFEPTPLVLPGLPAGEAARRLIERRLAPAFEAAQVSPPYASWPFRPEAFEGVAGWAPRQLLMRCDAHVNACLDKGQAEELPIFEPAGPVRPTPPVGSTLDGEFARQTAAANLAALTFEEDRDETPMRALLESLGRVFCLQNAGHPDIDIRMETAFDPRRPALHLRLEHVHRAEGDREEIFAFRFLPHHHPISFQARLKAAVTQAGIDRKLKFRHLVLLRAGPPPSGARTSELMDQFRQAGGVLLEPSEEDLRALMALATMEKARPDGFAAWLATRRPLDALGLAAAAGAAWPRLVPPRGTDPGPEPDAPPKGTKPTPEPEPLPPSPPPEPPGGRNTPTLQNGANPPPPPRPGPEPMPEPGPRPAAAMPPDAIPIGQRIPAGAAPLTLPLALMKKHVAIVAGSGSGKTVLLRRVIEEAARRGVPAIVVDTNNDLALLGEPWPAEGRPLKEDDRAAAADYFARAEVVVWTPGLKNGNPLTLAPLPDFAALRDDEEELERAVELAATTLEPLAASGRGDTGQIRQGLLRSAMRAFARRGTGGLEGFIDFLSELPPDAGAGISRYEQHALRMADSLKAAVARNPLMASYGTPLDPSQLITASEPGKVRVSVLNLSGLASADAQQEFVNRLALALFTFVRRNPPKDGAALKALLAIDEAHQFAPSGTATPSRESLVSLAKQARKYGLALLFATQMPKDLHHHIINNCATQIFGKASSPAALDTIAALMAARGRYPADIAQLTTGTFYVCADAAPPEKVVTPLCLSHHPSSPPDQRRIVELAAGIARTRQPEPVA